MLKRVAEKYENMSLPLKAGVWFFICNLLQKGISVITSPIFTRLLSTAEYGVFTIYFSWRDILAIFITFGLSSSVYQKKLVELTDEGEKKILTSSLQGLATATALVSFGVYFLLRKWLNPLFALPTEYVVAIYISVLVTTAFDFWAMKKRVEYSYKSLVIVTAAVVILKPTLSILAIKLFPTHRIDARIYMIVSVEVAAYIVIYIRQFSEGKRFYHKKNWRYAMVYVLPLIPHYLSQRVLSQSDKIMINAMCGESAAGIYGLAHSIGWMMTLVVSACDSVMAPWVYQKIKEKNKPYIRKIMVYPLLGMALACLAFIAIAPEAVRIFAPAEYYEAIWALPPFIISTFFILLYSFFIYFEYYFEKTKYIMIATMASAALNIVLNYVFIKAFGYIAASYTTLACYVFYTFAHYTVYSKICREKFDTVSVYNMKAVALISGGLLGAGLGITALYSFPVARYALIAAMAVAAVLYKKKIITLFKTVKGRE